MANVPKHGTATAYRNGCRCDVCKAAQSRRARLARSRANPGLAIVDAVFIPKPVPAVVSFTPTDESGATERAARAELAQLPADTPFLGSMTAAAIVLAREIDNAGTKSAAVPAKQLMDIFRELTRKGGGSGDSFDEFLRDLAQNPLGGSPVRNTP